MKFIGALKLLLLALWLGAAVYFSAVVAPSAFSVLPTRDLAGNVVNRTLMILNLSAVVIAVLALLLSFVGANTNKFFAWLERGIYILIAGVCAIGQLVVGSLMAGLRAQMGGPIDDLPLDNAMRIQFNSLHQYSVWLLMAAMIAALVAFFLVALRPATVKQENPVDPLINLESKFKI